MLVEYQEIYEVPGTAVSRCCNGARVDSCLGDAAMDRGKSDCEARRYVCSHSPIFTILSLGAGEGWTRNHGFFILMGGFHVFTRKETEDPIRSPGDPCYPLDQKSVVTLVEHGHIELPLEEEIQDRSKTD